MWKIDHLFVSEKLAGRATAIDLAALNPDFTNSDHMPLGVELSASLTA
jgi:exonuclease III